MVVSTTIPLRRLRRTTTFREGAGVGMSTPLLFGAAVALVLARFSWPWRWLQSGAPVLTLVILLGSAKGQRVLPFIPLWTLLPTLNLAFAVASTSWLLRGAFAIVCWPVILVVSLFQSRLLADFTRARLRRLLKRAQFVNDAVALFDIPALEIDTEVDGLMVVRGITLSLSSLTIVAHGVEVGIRLSADMELALQAEKVTVELFRRITVSPVYANVKGGQYEMTFGGVDRPSAKADDEAFMVSGSAMLERASTTGSVARPPMIRMTSRLTNGATMKNYDSKAAFKHMTKLSPDHTEAVQTYESTIRWIEKTNLIHQCHQSALQLRKEQGDADLMPTENEIRAAVSTMLHSEPSIPHPPDASIKVTTLQKLSSPRTKRIMHRMPMLLRLLLNPLGYFHPIKIEALVAAGSGKWITAQLEQHIFQQYASDNAELRRLQGRVLSWLSDANFVLSMDNVLAQGNVPFLSDYDIMCHAHFSDFRAFRTISDAELRPIQVIHMGGADATFSIPTFLLPHHEHIVPPLSTAADKALLKEEVTDASGSPQAVHKEKELEQAHRDETNVQLSVHALLPATFDQELLNFVAALVKATKVVELERGADATEGYESQSAFRELAHTLNKGMKDSMKKVVAEGIVNDRWIAKMVGKITKHLQTAQGEIGYSGDIPVALGPYRLPEGHPEADKILG